MKNDHQNYCIIYYPIFSGKCHPNNALNILYKLYQSEVYGSFLDISKIELYLKLDKNNYENNEITGFFFRYAGGISFKSEDIQDCQWKFFPIEKSSDKNYISIGNWAHYYEWRFDLLLDQNKFEEYSPWIIKKWDKINLKPLTNEIKYIFKWKERFQDLEPHLLPDQISDNKNISLKPKIDPIMENIKKAIRTIFNDEIEIKKKKDIMGKIFEFKSFFRDLNR
ncbi:MAG: hypothetical protein JXA99_02695 [Candidatus Lokiarchaeota archaeon]|nr:hypothetical protein [Candidatus Lokiarchaeota archaeon]